MILMRDFGDDVFAGAAEYYAKYRPKYPEMLFHDIVHFYQPDGSGTLLDLGCGTGELARPLAKSFAKVVALDPDSDMLKIGQRIAKAAKIANISWQKGSSKELIGVKGRFDLITMGQSFHWMDQEPVLNRLHELLEGQGGLFIVGSVPAVQNSRTAQKDETIKSLVTKYLGPQRRAGNSIYEKPPKAYIDLFDASKFKNYKSRIYETKVIRNVNQELGNLYSMSWGRRIYLGDKIGQFEQEFKDEISRIPGPGNFENLIRFEAYFLSK